MCIVDSPAKRRAIGKQTADRTSIDDERYLHLLCFNVKILIAASALEGCISPYTRLLYWSDASHNTLDYCIGGMHLTIH